VAVVVALVGLVFTAQGLGAPIGRSFMIGDLRWTAIGVAMIAGAALYAWRRTGRHVGRRRG
jgi:protein-S-isoprenylcysteine O-methyltransferase Ste14